MKNKKLKIIGIAVAALMVIAAVCAVAYHFRPVFEVGFFDDSIIVEARRAAADACETGNITVAEGQMVEIKADLRAEDTVRVELFPADDKEMTEPVFWGDFSAGSGSSFTLSAGEYAVRITAQKGATGSLTLNINAK